MEDRGLDLNKNLLPPPREKFVLDIPFLRTVETKAGAAKHTKSANRLADEALGRNTRWTIWS